MVTCVPTSVGAHRVEVEGLYGASAMQNNSSFVELEAWHPPTPSRSQQTTELVHCTAQSMATGRLETLHLVRRRKRFRWASEALARLAMAPEENEYLMISSATSNHRPCALAVVSFSTIGAVSRAAGEPLVPWDANH